MRVRYLGYTSDGERRRKLALSVGRDYVVLAINVNARETRFLILGDQFVPRPGWYPAPHFDLVADDVPSNWRIRIGAMTNDAAALRVAPASWLEPGFFEHYEGDGNAATLAARSAFDRELAVILKESLPS
jgi:hypothetical protein